MMFTIEEIRAAHAKVRSGADFPAYIREIKVCGVRYYETFVEDGHTDFYGRNDCKISSPAKYDPLAIAVTGETEKFKEQLKAHQEGKTDYLAFCSIAAGLGVNKWAVSMEKMTCTYFDIANREMLTEIIPA